MTSIIPEELNTLLLARYINHSSVRYYQNASGRLYDVLIILRNLFSVYESALLHYTTHLNMHPEQLFKSIFLTVVAYKSPVAGEVFQQNIRSENASEILPTSFLKLNRLAEISLIELLTGSNSPPKVHLSFTEKRINWNPQNRELSPAPTDIPVGFEHLKRYLQRACTLYQILSFRQWFPLMYNELETETVISIKHYVGNQLNIKTPDNKLFDALIQIYIFLTGICYQAADRALLQYLFSHNHFKYIYEQNTAFTILGSALSSSKQKSLFSTAKTHTGVKNSNQIQSHNAGQNLIIASHNPAKLKTVIEWIQSKCSGRRIIVVAPSEDELLYIAQGLHRTLKINAFYLFDAGTFVFKKGNIELCDTTIFIPSSTSEELYNSPLNTVPVALYSYEAFFNTFFNPDSKDSKIYSGEIILGALIFWGVPYPEKTAHTSLHQMIQLVSEQNIQSLMVISPYEEDLLKLYQEESASLSHFGIQKNVSEQHPEIFATPLMKSPFLFTDDDGKAHPEFISTIIKHWKEGFNQLILLPNPAAVQTLYYELRTLSKKYLMPKRNSIIYHSYFIIADKINKWKTIEMLSRRNSPSVVISTPCFFPLSLFQYKYIFIESLPVKIVFQYLTELLYDYHSTAVPQIMWSLKHYQRLYSLLFQTDEKPIPLGTLNMYLHRDIPAIIQEADLLYAGEMVPLFPKCFINSPDTIDAGHRILMPISICRDFAKIEFEDNLPSQNPRMKWCDLLYNADVGIISPSEWRELYLP